MVFLAINTKAVLSVALVALTVVGGCRARLAGEEARVGSITGVVTVEDVNLASVNPTGWLVTVNGQSLQGVVNSDGTYVIAGVPPGTYSVALQVPPQEGVVAACSVPGCSFPDVSVLADASTMHVDFGVSFVPAPPFQ